MFNGHGIKSLATAIPVKTLLHGARTKPGAVYYPTQLKAAAVVAGDASDKAVCAYTVSGPDLYINHCRPIIPRASDEDDFFLYLVFCKRAKRLSFFEQILPRAGGGNFFSYMGFRERARRFSVDTFFRERALIFFQKCKRAR